MSTLAAIDVGSHAIRLSVVKITSVGAVTEIEFQRWPIRLGSDAFAHGRIRPERIRKLIGVFQAIADHLSRLGVEAYRAVATSAMRDASNGPQIIARIRRAIGIDVEIISGKEEGRMSRDALVRALGSVPPDTLLVDLGGGSLELRRARGPWGRSLPLGTVRLLERYPALTGALKQTETHRIQQSIQTELSKRLNGGSAPLAIGTGGNLNVLARLVPSKPGFHPAINVRRLPAVAARIAAIPPADRVSLFGLRPDRADVLTPAVLVILAVARHFDVRCFVIPGTGLRETILRALATTTEDQTRACAVLRRLGRANAAEPVPRLATSLFDLLAPMHGLWTAARAPLMAAAYLKKAMGTQSVDHVGGLGLDERGRQVATYAAVAASGAEPDHVGQDDCHTAEVLAGVLRIASALASRGGSHIDIDLTTSPVHIHAGLPRALPQSIVQPLANALQTKLRVR
ncbi:hypothetical protein ACFL6C_04420 [Myxococcota bacterium]